MYLFIHAAERENAFLMLVWKSKEFDKNKDERKSTPRTTMRGKELLFFLVFVDVIVFQERITPHRRAGQSRRGKKAPDVLVAIDALLRRFSLSPKDLKGICVLSGPGQFSFLRSSIVTANTFGLALNIPVVGIAGSDFATDKEFVTRGMLSLRESSLSASGGKRRGNPVVPAYGKEPNITIARKRV